MPRSQHPSALRSRPAAWPDVMSAHPHSNGEHVGAAQRRPWPDVMSAHPQGNGQHVGAAQRRPWPDVMSAHPYSTAPRGQRPSP